MGVAALQLPLLETELPDLRDANIGRKRRPILGVGAIVLVERFEDPGRSAFAGPGGFSHARHYPTPTLQAHPGAE
jgi:ADP-ribose pyrophosphatase YjhB (NUDIX family)